MCSPASGVTSPSIWRGQTPPRNPSLGSSISSASTGRCRYSSSIGPTGQLHGDFGESFLFHESVAQLVKEHLPITFTLGLLAIAIAIVVALPLGIVAALNEGTAIDVAISMLTLAGQAIPSFWLGLMLIIWFGVDLGWLPIAGVDDWTGYILPAVVLASVAIPAMLRLTRGGMVDAMRADYIRTARAKGLSRASIVLKHALRNAAMPIVAVSAVQLGFILGGSVVTEVVFNVRGVGYLAWESIQKGDFPVIQAVVLLFALVFIVLTLLADLLNAALDPRLRTV